MKGTLINTAAVVVGATIGCTVGRFLPPGDKSVAMEGIGLVVCLISVKMFFASKNAVISIAAIATGGILGALLGIAPGLEAFAEWARSVVGANGHFNEAIISTSVLYCVGPMTLLGCLQDGVEGKTELLVVKSTLDGISAIFISATLGPGVFVTALVVLVFQGALTLAARPLKGFLRDEALISESTAVGGAMMLAIGLNLVGITHIHAETYLPALVLAPVFAAVAGKFQARRAVTE